MPRVIYTVTAADDPESYKSGMDCGAIRVAFSVRRGINERVFRLSRPFGPRWFKLGFSWVEMAVQSAVSCRFCDFLAQDILGWGRGLWVDGLRRSKSPRNSRFGAAFHSSDH